MIYERVCYMCPKCDQMNFFNNNDEFSTICSHCNVEMICVEKKFVSSEEEEKKERMRNSALTVCCPYCNSLNTQKISTTSKVFNTALFGVFGTKRHKEWHCNRCGSDF